MNACVCIYIFLFYSPPTTTIFLQAFSFRGWAGLSFGSCALFSASNICPQLASSPQLPGCPAGNPDLPFRFEGRLCAGWLRAKAPKSRRGGLKNQEKSRGGELGKRLRVRLF